MIGRIMTPGLSTKAISVREIRYGASNISKEEMRRSVATRNCNAGTLATAQMLPAIGTVSQFGHLNIEKGHRWGTQR
jgi:hypothetical protein